MQNVLPRHRPLCSCSGRHSRHHCGERWASNTAAYGSTTNHAKRFSSALLGWQITVHFMVVHTSTNTAATCWRARRPQGRGSLAASSLHPNLGMGIRLHICRHPLGLLCVVAPACSLTHIMAPQRNPVLRQSESRR
jgi:hypothetical protein